MCSPPINGRYYSDDYLDDFKEEDYSDAESYGWDGSNGGDNETSAAADLAGQEAASRLDKCRAETDLSKLVGRRLDQGGCKRPGINCSLPSVSRNGTLNEKHSFISLPEKIYRVKKTSVDLKIDEVKSDEESDKPEKDKYSTISYRRGRTEKYEIPSFYVLDREGLEERTGGGRSYKRVNLFTLPPSESERDVSKRRSHHLAQGDSPWILILDGSEESDVEDDGACGDEGGLHVSVESGAQHPQPDLHIQVTRPQSTAQPNSNPRKESGVGCVGEGKISSFFSRLRRNPSSVAPPHPNNNGKESYNSIVSQQETQTPSKKSKMCQIL